MESLPPPHLVAVMGPTASGKTALAERLADLLDAQLFAADAFQVYRGFDIGTAKPTDRSRYQLLDFKDPWESCSVVEWVQRACRALEEAYSVTQNVVLVGGTGLYIRALTERFSDLGAAPDPELRAALLEREEREGLPSLVEELQRRAPELAATLDLANPLRVRRALERLNQPYEPISVTFPPYSITKLGIAVRPEALDRRILERMSQMVQNGWVAEVRRLRAGGVTEAMPAMRALGYRELLAVVEGRQELDSALVAAALQTRRYAKRQRTWLRSEPNLHTLSGELALDEQVRIAMGLILNQGKGNGKVN